MSGLLLPEPAAKQQFRQKRSTRRASASTISARRSYCPDPSARDWSSYSSGAGHHAEGQQQRRMANC
eukprot:2748029-Pleurochrysis_carterae.AAC.2